MLNKGYRTNDGGANWSLQSQIQDLGNCDVKSVFLLNDKEGWAVGIDRANQSGGVVLHTKDGGRQWQLVKAAEKERIFDRILFEDRIHGWLFGFNKLYRTDDGGQSWRESLDFLHLP